MPATLAPNMGLYLDRPGIQMDPRAISDGRNFRIREGTVSTVNMGWTKFSDQWTLDGNPVTLIDNFFPRDQDEKLIFGTPRDLYLYDASTDSVSYLNEQYDVGTASASGTAVTGVGTNWDPTVEAGDFISFGAANENDPGATWFEIDSVTNDTALVLTTTAGTVANGPYTIRKVFSPGPFDTWDFDTFVQAADGDDHWIATNGVDWVVSWNGTDATVVSQASMNFTCQSITVFSNMVIYGNITSGGVSFPSSFINSDVGSPFAAGDDGVGLSDQFQVHGGSDGIINAVPLGDSLAIYSGRHLVMAQFVGDPLVFIFRIAASGVGPISGDAVADFGDFHEFIGADTQYTFDGVTLAEVNAHVFRDILRRADPLRRHLVYGHFDEERGDLIWSIPLTTDDGVGDPEAPPEQAYLEHYLEDPGRGLETPFGHRDFPFTYTGFYEQATGQQWQDFTTETWADLDYSWNDQFLQSGFPLNLAGDVNGQIYVLNTSAEADGAAMPNWARFNTVALGSGRERSLVKRFYPFLRAGSGIVEIITFMSDFPSKNLTPVDTQEYDKDGTRHFVVIYRRARFASFRVGSPIGVSWILEGYDYDFVTGGTR